MYYHGNSNNDGVKSTNNEVNGKASYVGGAIGQASGGTMTNVCSENNTKVIGTSYVGGVIGYYSNAGGIVTDIKSINNNNITGTSYVGGCIGYSAGRIKNAKTEYSSKAALNNIIGTEYVGGIVGIEVYNVINTGITYYSIDGAFVKNANISGTNYVGGMCGSERGTVYAAAIDNCSVTATGDNIGGILGFYQGSTDNDASKIACKNFYLMHSFCVNTKVEGNSNVGGLVGNFVYGNIQFCYVGNTSINAITKNAGGLVGYLDNKNMTEKQYIATIEYNYIANVTQEAMTSEVSSPDSVGGLIGTIYMELLPDYIKSDLIVTNISANTDYVSMGIGKVETTESLGTTQSSNMSNIYVYDCSYIGKAEKTQRVYEIEKEEEAYHLVTSLDLGNSETYKKADGLGFVDSIGRYIFEDGYFPILATLTATTTQTYWGADNLNVQQNKISVPSDVRMTSIDENKISTLIKIPSYLEELPKVDVYPVDINKINIEFSKTNPDVYFEVKTNEGTIVSKEIKDKVYTLEYDFNTPIIITISNLKHWYTKEIKKEDVCNILDIVGDEYFYITDNKLHSNKKDIEGEYIHLYNGKALTSNGNIYNMKTMEVEGKNDTTVQILDNIVPVIEANYGDNKIQTFYHFSKITQEEKDIYKDKQVIIKNNIIYLLDGNLNHKGNGIIVDSYNNKQYETVLGNDGRIYDLLTEIKYPKDFKNQNIIAMTNNLNSDSNIVLVYYETGKVIGFNYTTGDVVFDNNIKEETISLLDYIQSKFNLQNIMYSMEKADYIEAEKLAKQLKEVSIKEALEEINSQKEQYDNKEFNVENEQKEGSVANNVPNSREEYITTYNPETQSYEVYSTSELLEEDTEQTTSEDKKIYKNKELLSYYTEMSTSQKNQNNIGTIIFYVIIEMVCLILVVFYIKNSRENR